MTPSKSERSYLDRLVDRRLLIFSGPPPLALMTVPIYGVKVHYVRRKLILSVLMDARVKRITSVSGWQLINPILSLLITFYFYLSYDQIRVSRAHFVCVVQAM